MIQHYIFWEKWYGIKYFEGSDIALHIFKTNNSKSGYSSKVITIKNVYISYKIFCAMLGLSSVQHHNTLILGSLSHSTLRKAPHCLWCSLSIISKINAVKCMQFLFVSYILGGGSCPKVLQRKYKYYVSFSYIPLPYRFSCGWNCHLWHCAYCKQGPNLQWMVQYLRRLSPSLPEKLNEYLMCNRSVNSVLNIIDINEIMCLIKTRHRKGSRVCLKRDGTCAETRFGLSPKRTSPFKSEGASVQSTAGSRGVRISVSNAG